MERADEFGWKVLGDKLISDLRGARLNIPEQWRCSAKALEELNRQVRALPSSQNTKLLRRLYAKYRLYLYGHYVFMTGSYHAFLAYAEKLAKRRWLPDRMLLGEPIFRRLIATAEYYRDEHPKVKRLERLLLNLRRTRGRAIVFFSDRKTAQYCRTYLEERCILTETVFGGVGSIQRQEMWLIL
jgi:ERCC4-related helicase